MMPIVKSGLCGLGVAGLVWAGAVAPAYGQMPAPKRFPQITVEDLNAQQRPVAEEILKVSSLGLAGPYNPLLRSPMLADRMVKLLDYLRFNTSVPRRLNEFAILIQARIWTSQVEWVAHHPLALKAGLAASVADDLKAGRRPTGMMPDEELVYDLSIELSTQHSVSDATFARAKALFTDQQIVDLVTVSGTYASVAMLLAVAAEPAAGGQTPLQPIGR